MPRHPRFDQPGRWFHVMNRGIAKRPIFENRRDVRYFLSRLAYAVRRGELEVHAFCVMATHYHLLVRSPTGQLSEGMRRIQNEYVRYFNRTRRRDGPLFRGRFLSKPVLSLVYRRILVRYIDENPVEARLVRVPWAYTHGSAVRFASGRIPAWLSSEWVMAPVEAVSGATYESVWGRRTTATERELVERRLAGHGLLDDPLDDLVRASPVRVRNWMTEKTRLADATRPGLTCVPPSVVNQVVNRLRDRGRVWRYRTPAGQRRDAWNVAHAGLLRQLSGLTYQQIATHVGVSPTMVRRRIRAHRDLCASIFYARRLGRVATLCMRTAFPERARKVRNRS